MCLSFALKTRNGRFSGSRRQPFQSFQRREHKGVGLGMANFQIIAQITAVTCALNNQRQVQERHFF
ncbi:hypothetical protein SADFL11_00049270 [Roseibium alexandrii DFL-11]|uniref:Uncharacterized protein n=1 Tax=Roseibium alexandrii (strain DSM 17067 / NCIMB 14079 / DFL-11) TaxID=244592 RepID=A0A5E8UX09_ROSAD|nr:hypothetical protein SADFL11_00049270 [Roseibium alexandrii DFL-11]